MGKIKIIVSSLLVLVLVVLAACAGQAATTPTSAPRSTAVPPARVSPAATPLASAESSPTPAPTQAAQVSPPSPACDSTLTPSQTEGPYYTVNTPERASLLEPGMTGTKLIITGYVLSKDCQPIAGAWLDFWQADDQGQYDNAGYRLRGHQFTDEGGRYRLETIVPGLYPGRTRHIHVKVQAPNQPALTTQLYFPAETANNADSIYNPALLLNVQDTADGKVATFDFVLDLR